ncbi:C2H2-type domain-containing protein [Plasmodiophora brassicae]|uniref:C2H2-type domain-containing protein n=1 Tax=Plasmodiophora brassicae TaxID=37360 RepID=A0A0G4IIK3_PLABS|nr:hypothetical protein PBRA_003817 [Plasmodiophora brassicae]SPQ94333.1 unnamed protein product [Plasmodiophora brassicae]
MEEDRVAQILVVLRVDALTQTQLGDGIGDPQAYKCTCPVCLKTFQRPCGMKDHHRTVHKKEKLYTCDVCDKPFGHRSHVKRHMRTHTGEHKYACALCDTTFTENGSLKRHMRRKHPLQGEVAPASSSSPSPPPTQI